jgi:hypothetical protein
MTTKVLQFMDPSHISQMEILSLLEHFKFAVAE